MTWHERLRDQPPGQPWRRYTPFSPSHRRHPHIPSASPYTVFHPFPPPRGLHPFLHSRNRTTLSWSGRRRWCGFFRTAIRLLPASGHHETSQGDTLSLEAATRADQASKWQICWNLQCQAMTRDARGRWEGGGGVSGWRERGREKERGMKTNQSRVPTHTPLSFPDPCLEWLGSGHAQSCVKRND